MKRIFLISNWILTSFLFLLLCFNLYSLTARFVFKVNFPKLFGFATAQVISGSMGNALKVGDMIIIHKQKDYKVNDIITFRKNSLITHRIVSKTPDGYITKGDANNVEDGIISFDKIEGRVIFIIPKIGYVIDFIKTPPGMLLIIITGFLLIEIPYKLKIEN